MRKRGLKSSDAGKPKPNIAPRTFLLCTPEDILTWLQQRLVTALILTREAWTAGPFDFSYSLEMAVHAIGIDACQIADHPEIPAWILPDPSSRENLLPQRLLAGRLQIAHDGQKDVLPEPLFRTHRDSQRLR
jgi:hypothetical protein